MEIIFERVNVQIPKVIEELFLKIEKVEKDSCIAGGFISDLYMNKPYNDVDIFVNEKSKNEVKKLFENLNINLNNITDGYSTILPGENGVFEAKFSGFQLHLIFTDLGAKIVEYFDVRFREFYYQCGATFASKEAIWCIKNKKIKIGKIHSYQKTMHRVIRFTKRYDFVLDEKHRMLFYAEGTRESDFRTNIIACKGNSETITRLLDMNENVCKEIGLNLLLPKFIGLIEEKERNCIKFIKNNMLSYSIYDPKKSDEIRENIENKTYFYSIFKSMVRLNNWGEQPDFKEVKKEIRQKIEDVERFSSFITNIVGQKIIISDKFFYQKNIYEKVDIYKILNGKIISIRFGYKEMVIDIETNQIIINDLNGFDEIMNLIIEKIKEELKIAIEI
jgi:hypothetical protein